MTTPQPDNKPASQEQGLRPLLLAGGAAIALWFVPYAAAVTYPLRLLVTFLHEGGHALAALATGGVVRQITIHPDGSGTTLTQGGMALLIVSAGYLGAMLAGASLLALVRRGVSGRMLLSGVGVWVALLTLLFVRPWPSPFGFVWGAALGGALVLAGLRLPERPARWVAAFLGVQCTLNALFDLRVLLNLSWGYPEGGPATDALLLSRILPLPAVVWALFWIALSFILLYVVLRPTRRRT